MKNALPKIPVSEYPERWAKVQQVLADEKLDMLLVYADDRHTYGAAYARYYGNLPVAFEPVLLLLSLIHIFRIRYSNVCWTLRNTSA